MRRLPLLLARALLLRCPECGGRDVFASWFRMRGTCPTCALPLDRGERGYQVGSYMLNIIAAELLFLALFLGVIAVTWPEPPWALLQYGGAALMVLAPMLLYPFTKTVFLAIDLAVRPATTPHLGEEHRGHHRALMVLLAVLVAPAPATGQGLPALRPVNPVMSSRSILGFEPLVVATAGWSVALGVDHGNVREVQDRPGESLLVDGEFTRVELGITRVVGARGFVIARIPVERSGAGFLDGFVDWWHEVFALEKIVNDTRPNDVYAYRVRSPDGEVRDWEAGRLALGDLRLGAGFRHRPDWQTVLTVALPTSGRPEGYRLGTAALAVTTTAGAQLRTDRLRWEGSAGVGYTPAAGPLRAWQREWFGLLSSGVRWRVVGQQAVYANVLLQSGPLRDTQLSMLGGEDLTLDFGFLLRPAHGPEILVAMTEDLYPGGPSPDFVFRLGVRR